jgi:hypothetical protein
MNKNTPQRQYKPRKILNALRCMTRGGEPVHRRLCIQPAFTGTVLNQQSKRDTVRKTRYLETMENDLPSMQHVTHQQQRQRQPTQLFWINTNQFRYGLKRPVLSTG